MVFFKICISWEKELSNSFYNNLNFLKTQYKSGQVTPEIITANKLEY